MTRKTLLEELESLSAAERILLAQDLWDSVAADPEAWELTPAQRRELTRRLRAFRDRRGKGPAGGATWKQVRSRIQRGK